MKSIIQVKVVVCVLLVLTLGCTKKSIEVQPANVHQNPDLVTLAEAKKIAEQEKIDLYILGLELQDCSGFDICRYIRDQDYGRSVPIIFMSSTDTMDNREAGENAGGSDFITKNVLSEKIRELINRWLNPDKTLVGMRALVIDDQLTSRLVISNFLEHEGVEVVGCPSGEKGLESLREAGDNFDMIITDNIMPGLTGIDLTKKILNY